jgi:hypothetical protein
MTTKAFWGRFIVIPTIMVCTSLVYSADQRNQKSDNTTTTVNVAPDNATKKHAPPTGLRIIRWENDSLD